MKKLLFITLFLASCAEVPAQRFYPSSVVFGWQDKDGNVHVTGARPTDNELWFVQPQTPIEPLGWDGAGGKR